MDKAVKTPSPDHPITIERNPDRIIITFARQIIADTKDGLILKEADYPPVHYIPLKDVNVPLLKRTDHTTYCPYKGDCSYYTIVVGKDGENAVWQYDKPYEAVAAIKDHVAFYPDRVEITNQPPVGRPALGRTSAIGGRWTGAAREG